MSPINSFVRDTWSIIEQFRDTRLDSTRLRSYFGKDGLLRQFWLVAYSSSETYEEYCGDTSYVL